MNRITNGTYFQVYQAEDLRDPPDFEDYLSCSAYADGDLSTYFLWHGEKPLDDCVEYQGDHRNIFSWKPGCAPFDDWQQTTYTVPRNHHHPRSSTGMYFRQCSPFIGLTSIPQKIGYTILIVVLFTCQKRLSWTLSRLHRHDHTYEARDICPIIVCYVMDWLVKLFTLSWYASSLTFVNKDISEFGDGLLIFAEQLYWDVVVFMAISVCGLAIAIPSIYLHAIYVTIKTTFVQTSGFILSYSSWKSVSSAPWSSFSWWSSLEVFILGCLVIEFVLPRLMDGFILGVNHCRSPPRSAPPRGIQVLPL